MFVTEVSSDRFGEQAPQLAVPVGVPQLPYLLVSLFFTTQHDMCSNLHTRACYARLRSPFSVLMAEGSRA